MIAEDGRPLSVVIDPEQVPEDMREAWVRVEAAKGLREPMRRALFRVACGADYQEVAEAGGYAHRAPVWRKAKAFGIANAKKDRLLDRQRRIAELGGAELERRLEEHPESFKDWDLVKVTGVAVDKLSEAEGWKAPKDQGGSYLDMRALLDQLTEKGVTVDLQLRPPDPSEQAIDVTPVGLPAALWLNGQRPRPEREKSKWVQSPTKKARISPAPGRRSCT